MFCVIDASIAAAWVIDDEKRQAADAVLQRVEVEGAGVPDLFWHEIRNILLKVERRGRSALGAAEASIGQLRQLSLIGLPTTNDSSILSLGRAHGLTAYDAPYLDVAISTGLPLATADRRLGTAARACRLAVLGPLAP